MSEAINILGLVLGLALFVSAAVLLRPANGSRPLLVGFMFSAIFGLVIAVTRVFSLGSIVRPWFGLVLVFYLFVKLRALYAAATHETFPFVAMARKGWQRVNR